MFDWLSAAVHSETNAVMSLTDTHTVYTACRHTTIGSLSDVMFFISLQNNLCI